MESAVSSRETEAMDQSSIPATERCYAVLLRRDDGQVLLSKNGDRFGVPVFEIPRQQRVSPNLLSAIHRRLDLIAICRFSVSLRDLVPDGYCVVLEVPDAEPTDGHVVWIDVHAIEWDSIEADAARDVLWTALAKTTAFNAGQVAGRFVQPGWLTEVLGWAKTSLAGRHVELTGKWSQYNMGPDFALLRLDAKERDIWFKAVGEPNLREFGITKRFAELRLPHLPPLLATREDWHGWLMFDCGEAFLDEGAEPQQWACAARALAELQIESIGQVAQILDSGARDRRAHKLCSLVDPFLDLMGTLMEEQTTVSPAALNRGELAWLGKQMRHGLVHLDELGIPDTLGHLDLNPGNIVLSRKECVFLDWAEACVGHPFFSFQYLREHFRRAVKPDARLEAQLIGAYAECWQPRASAEAINEALAISPMLAAFAWAAGHDSWAKRERGSGSEAAILLRSVTRRMHREALRWTEGGSRCQV
jgi:hypothetical protein